MIYKFLLAHSEDFMSESEAKNFFNARPEIGDWIRIFDNVYVVSSTTSDASLLNTAVLNYTRKNRGTQSPFGTFLMFEIPVNRQGYLQKVVWDFMNNSTIKALAGDSFDDAGDDEIPF